MSFCSDWNYTGKSGGGVTEVVSVEEEEVDHTFPQVWLCTDTVSDSDRTFNQVFFYWFVLLNLLCLFLCFLCVFFYQWVISMRRGRMPSTLPCFLQGQTSTQRTHCWVETHINTHITCKEHLGIIYTIILYPECVKYVNLWLEVAVLLILRLHFLY